MDASYNDLPRYGHRGGNKLSIRPMLVVIATLAVVIFTLVRSTSIQGKNLSGALTPHPSKLITGISHRQGKPTLSQVLNEVKDELENAVGNYSIFVYDLSSDESYGLNEHTLFDAASISKVIILASLYDLAEKGEIDLDKTVTIQEKDIQDYGSGPLRYESLGKTYTLKALAQTMMEKSDNTAAYVLGFQIIKQPVLKQMVQNWGLTQTDMDDNVTSNFDMATLFKKLYKSQIVNQPLQLEMFDFMKDTDYEDRIPVQLPQGTIVYHKTGDQVSVAHDVGIVDIKDRPYYIGIMTSNMLIDEVKVKESMARVSKIIFDYQSNLRR